MSQPVINVANESQEPIKAVGDKSAFLSVFLRADIQRYVADNATPHDPLLASLLAETQDAAGKRSLMVVPPEQGRLLTMKHPVGPCLLITPWNFPMAMGTRKIGPAIAAGCTMVLKPAQLTPLSMLALTRILDEAGLCVAAWKTDPTDGYAPDGPRPRSERVVPGPR